MARTLPGFCLVSVLLLPIQAAASTPGEAAVRLENKVYIVTMRLDIEAPPQQVRAVLTDYAHLHDITPGIVASEILPAPAPGLTRVRTELRDCVAFFCKSIEIVEDVVSDERGLTATVVPSLSDMKSGESSWQITATGSGTRIVFESRMEPRFWIPPLIGPKLIRNILQKRAVETGQNVEKLARTAGQGGPDHQL